MYDCSSHYGYYIRNTYRSGTGTFTLAFIQWTSEPMDCNASMLASTAVGAPIYAYVRRARTGTGTVISSGARRFLVRYRLWIFGYIIIHLSKFVATIRVKSSQVKSWGYGTHSRSEHPDPNFFLPPPLRGLWRGLNV